MIFVYILLTIALLGTLFGAVRAFEVGCEKVAYPYCIVGILIAIALGILVVF